MMGMLGRCIQLPFCSYAMELPSLPSLTSIELKDSIPNFPFLGTVILPPIFPLVLKPSVLHFWCHSTFLLHLIFFFHFSISIIFYTDLLPFFQYPFSLQFCLGFTWVESNWTRLSSIRISSPRNSTWVRYWTFF